MFKLMKYEFRKQAFSKFVILFLLGLVELFFAFGMITNNDERVMTSIALFMVLAFGSILFISFECIITYSNDLKTKCSYMLFMTPHSSYSIIGAKALSTIIQILVAGASFLVVGFLDFMLMVAKYSDLSKLLDYLSEIFQIKIDYSDVVIVIATILVSWIGTVLLAFFSITLSTTFLANKRGKGFVSFIIFILMNYVINKVVSLALGSTMDYTRTDFIFSILITAIFAAITYIGTAWMLEEKVSL